MRINTNVASMTAQENAANVNKNLSASLEKLSSGLRINKAADDASGMAIADKLRTQASSLGQAISNANSGNALVQIADKAMAEQSNILDIVKTKLIQASTSTTSAEGREAIRKDVNKLLEQLDNIASQTNYNGITLLQNSSTDDTATSTQLDFLVGETSANKISVDSGIRSNSSGLGGGDSTINDGTELLQGVTKLVQDDTAVIVTAKTVNDVVAVSGVAGSVAISDGNVITGKDQLTIDLINAAGGTNGVLTGSSSTIDFGDNNVSFEVKIDTINDTVTMTTTSTLAVTGATSTAAADLQLSGTVGLTGGDTLSSLKSLTDGQLTAAKAQEYMITVDTALSEVNTTRSEFGSTQNQLDSFIRNAMTTQTNIKAAESVIRDVDYAAESANFNKQNIIAQAGTYAMSQANAVQQNVMRLLQ